MKYCANDSCPYLARHGRRGEYLDRVELCAECGQRLTQGEAPQQLTETRWVDQTCVGTFPHSAEAHVARAKLETLGIPAVVLDQYLVGTNWLYSQAIGGVKLYVPSEHAEAAIEALEGDDAEALAAVPESSLPPASDELCPNCGAVGALGSGWFHRWRALSLLFTFPFLFWRRRVRCPSCGHEWRRSKGGHSPAAIR